jgi:hypothetical protein
LLPEGGRLPDAEDDSDAPTPPPPPPQKKVIDFATLVAEAARQQATGSSSELQVIPGAADILRLLDALVNTVNASRGARRKRGNTGSTTDN